MSEPTADLPLVSIIIPAYNAAATLAEAIDSALAQRYPRIEVLVVDDGSADRTPEVLRSYGDRIRWVRKDNGGLPAARNTGHLHTQGELIAWLDADDRAHPDRIALQVELLLRQPELVLVCSDFSAFRDTGPVAERFAALYYNQIADRANGLNEIYPTRGYYTPAHPEWLQEKWVGVPYVRGRVETEMVWGNFVHPPTVLFRRTLLEKIGELDTSAAPESDWEFFIRASRQGEIAHIDQPLLEYRLSPGQMSAARNIKASLLSHAYVLKKHVPQDPHRLPPAVRSVWRKQHGFLYARLARVEAETNSLSALGYLFLAAAHRHPPHSLAAVLVLIVLPVWAARAMLAGRRRVKRWLGQAGPAHAPLLVLWCLLQPAEWLPALF